MKKLIILFVLFASSTAFANPIPPIASFMGRHSAMVDNSNEYFLNASIVWHEEYAELNEVLSSINEDLSSGLEDLSVKRFEGNKNQFLNQLLGNDVPFFCATLDSGMDLDSEKCAELTSELLGDVIEKADFVYIVKAEGNSYGDWMEQALVLQFDDQNDRPQSLVIRFDIVHEI